MTARAAIVIPVLRQVDAWLAQCVESALGQTVDCEVIVVASPLTPGSNRSVLAGLSRSAPGLRILQQKEGGFAAALNLGIRSASAPRVGFLLSDDWLDPEAVEECLRSSADIVSTGFTVFAADGVTPIERAARTLRREEYERKADLEQKAAYLRHFFLFQKRALEMAGGLDESLGDSPGVDDYDLPWVLLDRGASVAIAGRSLYRYRDHAGERLTTRKREDLLATMERILDKHGVTGERKQRLLRAKARWFGRTMQSVLEEFTT